MSEVENNLYNGFQEFPGDTYLLDAEAEFASLISDSERARTSLQKAFISNPRSTHIAIRLAYLYKNDGNLAEAKEVLDAALDANPGERKLHYTYVKLLMFDSTMAGEEVSYHLQRAFTKGDKNYDAQILYGRQLFLNGDLIVSE